MIFLRSHPVQTILKWSQDGSSHPRFREEVLPQIPIPEPVIQLVPTLNSVVDLSLKRRTEAKKLLERAKAAIETAIEKGEAAALTHVAESE